MDLHRTPGGVASTYRGGPIAPPSRSRVEIGAKSLQKRPKGWFRGYACTVQKIVIAIVVIALAFGGGALAVACTGGGSGHENAGHDQYHEKPGCGPWKSDGNAGESGRHDGQPPKDDDRGDCPDPPAQHSYHQ